MERREFSPLQKVGFGLTSAGLTIGGLLANAAPAEAHTVHDPGTNANIPTKVEKIMNADTVYLGGIGCSGSLIRNSKNQPIGVLTAEHCFDTYNTLTKGTDGDKYYLSYGTKPSIPVQTGVNTYSGLKTVGYVDNLELSNDLYLSHDLAIGSFVGQSLSSVVKTYEKSALSAKAIKKLKPGTVVYDSGYPQYQPKNGGTIDRQDLKMKVLGIEEEDGATMLITDVKKSDDGAVCSPGISGSELFTVDKKGVKHPIATASVYYDLTGKISGSKMTPDFSYPKNTDGICGFSFELPDKHSGDVHIVNETSQIPGYVSDDDAATKAEATLNSSAQKTLINGVISLDKGVFLKDPIVIHEDNNGVNPESVFLYTQEDKAGNPTLQYEIMPDDELFSGVSVYSENAGTDLPELKTVVHPSLMGGEIDDPNDYLSDDNPYMLTLDEKGDASSASYVLYPQNPTDCDPMTEACK